MIAASRTPLVSEAVPMFLDDVRPRMKATGFRCCKSFLLGSDRPGRPLMGTPIARSNLANRRVGTLTREQLVEHWAHRCPERMAANTKKRNACFFNAFLNYCWEKGWLHPDALNAHMKGHAGNPKKDWIQPEPLVAIEGFLTSQLVDDDPIDEYRVFAFHFLADTGMRPAEAVAAQVRDLRVREGVIHVPAGKGVGDGKARDIRIDQTFITRFQEHCTRFNLKPNDYVFFRRAFRSFGGHEQTRGAWEVVDRSKPASTGTLRTFLAYLSSRLVDARNEGLLGWDEVPEFVINPSALRKTFACNQLILNRCGLGGMSLEQLQIALGHADLRTTRIYLPEVEKYLDELGDAVSTTDAARQVIEYKRQRESERRAA